MNKLLCQVDFTKCVFGESEFLVSPHCDLQKILVFFQAGGKDGGTIISSNYWKWNWIPRAINLVIWQRSLLCLSEDTP